jgi:hypothetical protein
MYWLTASWDGDENIIRFVYAAIASLKFGLLAGGLFLLVRARDRLAELEQRFGRKVEEIV